MKKFYHNNSYVYLNIKKDKNVGVENCKRCVFGRCKAKGGFCYGKCADFISVNSDIPIDAPLKEKPFTSKKHLIDYSKPFAIKVYTLESLNDKKVINLYISNKDYELDEYIKIDISSIFAEQLRKLLPGKQINYNGEIYIFKYKQDVFIKKNW